MARPIADPSRMPNGADDDDDLDLGAFGLPARVDDTDTSGLFADDRNRLSVDDRDDGPDDLPGDDDDRLQDPQNLEARRKEDENLPVEEQRRRHAQRVASRKEQEARRLAEENLELRQQLRVVDPLKELLTEDEELATIIRDRIKTRGLPQKPTKPEVPAGFSEEKAKADPNSPDAKYLRDLEQYRDAYGTYLEKRTEYLEKQLQQRAEQEEQARRQQQAMRQTYEALVADYGMTPAQAEHFIRIMGDDRMRSLPNLVKVYRAMTNQASRRTVDTAGPSARSRFGGGIRAVDAPQDMQKAFDGLLDSWKRPNGQKRR